MSPILASVGKKSFKSGKFPQPLKIARAIPIPKICEIENIITYRPFSTLPMLSKILKNIAYRQLYNYLEKFDILYRGQNEFRSK